MRTVLLGKVGRLVMALALVAGTPFQASAKWTRLDSENFIFVGDASEAVIRRVAERLEQFREALLRALPDAHAMSPAPTVVMVFDSDRSVTPVKPLFQGRPVELAGYFQAGDDLNYVAISAEFVGAAVLTVFHEYAHFLVGNSQGVVPPWVGEGLAELYTYTQQEGGGRNVVIGRAPPHHLELLKTSTMMPLSELMAVDHQSAIYNEGSRRGVFYAESWALAHYLSFGNPARAAQFRKYLSTLRTGVTSSDALTTAFGADLETLDRELFEYVRQYLFPAVTLKFSEKSASAVIPRGRALDDNEANALVADLQARVGRADEAKVKLAALLERSPSTALASTVLGKILERDGRFEEALPLLQRGASLAADDVLVQSAYARGLFAGVEAVRHDPQAVAEALGRARPVLQRAIDLAPNSAQAAWMLGYAELVGGGDLARATTLLERAVALAPLRENYRLLLAQALVRQGDLARATAHLGPLLGSGRTTEVREEARRILAAVADRRAQTAGAAPSPLFDSRQAPLGAASSASSLTTSGAPPRTSAGLQLDLRAVQAGEQRVLGVFQAVECAGGRIALLVSSEGRIYRFWAKQLSDIDFISYRAGAPGTISCGALEGPQRVLATFRAASDNAAAPGEGEAVAIELLPDDYQLPQQP